MKREITRRELLVGSTAALSLATVLRDAVAQQRPLPNILWLVSEDNPAAMVGCYGNTVVRTPNIDALAKKSVMYMNTSSNAPVCAPARFAILTGMYPPTCSPAQNMAAEYTHYPQEFKTYPELLRAAGYYCTNNAKTGWNCDRAPAAIWDESSNKAHYRNRPAGKPFMAVFNDGTSHESSNFTPLDARVKPADVTVPPYLPDTPEVRGQIATYYNRLEVMDANLGKRLAELEADGLADDTIVFYYGDNGGTMPRTKRFPSEQGMRVPMIVYVPPKWQEQLQVKPGTRVDDSFSFVDLAPTLLSILGQPTPPYMQGRAMFGPHAGAPRRYSFGMRNRMDERYDFVRTVSDGRYRLTRNYTPFRPMGPHAAFAFQAPAYQSWHREHLAGRLRGVQKEAATRFFEPDARVFEEFYDGQADYYQTTNLIGDLTHAAKINELRAALDQQMIQTHDNGFIPDGSPTEGYHNSRDPQAYPLKRLMELGAQVADRNPQHVSVFRAGLKDPNAIVRYWSATGLLALKTAAMPAKAELVRLAQEDSSVHVQIVAAEAITWLGESKLGVERLNAILETPARFPIRLQALNALTFVDRDAARAALPAIQRAANDTNEYVVDAGRYLEAVLTGTYKPEMKIFVAGKSRE
jgi:arylsulfatase A-like enzyme